MGFEQVSRVASGVVAIAGTITLLWKYSGRQIWKWGRFKWVLRRERLKHAKLKASREAREHEEAIAKTIHLVQRHDGDIKELEGRVTGLEMREDIEHHRTHLLPPRKKGPS